MIILQECKTEPNERKNAIQDINTEFNKDLELLTNSQTKMIL